MKILGEGFEAIISIFFNIALFVGHLVQLSVHNDKLKNRSRIGNKIFIKIIFKTVKKVNLKCTSAEL